MEDEKMSDEFKDVSTVPTLTLEPFQPEAEKQAVVKTEEPPMDETILTEEERKMVDEFAKQIDLTNSGLVLQYGAGTQKKMADFSESALDNVKSKDLGEVGELLSGVVKELKSFDGHVRGSSWFHRTPYVRGNGLVRVGSRLPGSIRHFGR